LVSFHNTSDGLTATLRRAPPGTTYTLEHIFEDTCHEILYYPAYYLAIFALKAITTMYFVG